VVRMLGIACIAGGALGVLIGTADVIQASSSSTPDDLWRYPWSSGTFLVVGLIWCVSHVLCLAGFVGLQRSRHGGTARAATVGGVLAIIGTMFILAGEVAGLWIGDKTEDSGAATLVASIYGVGTLCAIVGLTLIGRQVLRTGTWTGWRRWIPIVMAAWGVMLLWLPMTPLAPVGSFGIDILFVALGIALVSQPVPEPTDGA
jgi:hypothetical protein